jgi:Do/DeqQ family serine protease
MRHVLLIALGVSVAILVADGPAAVAAAPAPDVRAASATGAAPPSLAPMLARVSPAVVNVSVQGTMAVADNPILKDPLFREFFGVPENAPPPQQRFQAAGSGVIYDAALGYVLTNNHVVEHATKILVTLTDRRQLDAKLIASDPQSDIAILKIVADRLTSLPLGVSKQLQVGDYVVAIGNPFGVGQTATFGIVSALGRTGLGIERYEDFIQTDASINPGNSGGALVDIEGRLIGMNSAILSRGGGNVGIGFAVPVDMIKSVASQLITYGKVSRGSLGVTIQDLTPALAQAMGIAVSAGAVVTLVMAESAAAKAGLQEGDVIVALDGEPVTGSSQLRNAVGQSKPGVSVRLTLLRDGRERIVPVTLDAQAPATAQEAPARTRESSSLSGLTLAPIPRENPLFGKLRGVFITQVDPGSAAEEAGLREGDIVVSAGRVPVSTPAELARILRDQKKGMPLLLQIRRGEASLFTALGG